MRSGGSALCELYGLRRLVQVKPAVGGHGVFIADYTELPIQLHRIEVTGEAEENFRR